MKKVIRHFLTWIDRIMVRSQVAFIVLFKPKRRWLFLQMERKDLLNFLQKHNYSMNLKYHKLNSTLSVQLMEAITEKRERVEKPSEELTHRVLSSKEKRN